MNNMTRILIVEDEISDYDLAQLEIRKVVQECTFKRVETQNDFLEALHEFQPHIILSDYKLPGFDGGKVLELAQQHALFSPVIIWTGAMGEEMAAACMKMGASDYILKENIRQLGRAVLQALKERAVLLESRQAEEKYQAIFENSPIGIFQSTPQGRFISVNPAMARIYGYASAEEMISSITDISHQIYTAPEDRFEFTNLLETQHVVENFEWQNTRKDGSVFWTSTSARAVYDEAGNVSYYEGFLRDITARKEMDKKIAKSEQRFQSLIENGRENISLLAKDGTLLWEDPSLNIVLGYGRGEFIGRSLFELLHPEDLGWVSELFVILVHEPGKLQDATFRMKHSDGTWRWIEATATNMLDEPSVKAIVVNYRDITRRKEAEEALRDSEAKYRTLAENSLQGIAIFLNQRIAYVNAAMCTIMGYTAEELMEMPEDQILALTHPDDRTVTRERATKRQAGEPVSAVNDVRIIRKDGTIRWIQTFASSIEYDGQSAILSTSVDITERKQAEIELNQKNDDLALLNAVNQAVVRGQNLDSIINLLAQELKRIFSTVGSTIYMLTPDKKSLIMQQYSFSPEIAQRVEKLLGFTIPKIEIPIKEGGHFHKAMIARRSAITTDPREIQSWVAEFVDTKFLPSITKAIVRKLVPQIYKLLNIKSTIIVPLIFEEEILGFLDVSSPSLFTSNDLKRIESIGEQLTAVIQRQQANEKIRESEERFRLLFENSGEAVLITQLDGAISSANPEACKIFGRSEDEIRNLGRAGIVDPNDPRLPLALEERARTGKFKGELSLLRNDGSIFPGDVSTTIFRDSSGNEKTSMIIRDITERRRVESAEHEQRVLAEALRDTSQILSSTLDYGEVLDHILNAVGRVVPHDAATITLIDGEFARVVRSQGYDKRASNSEIMGVRLSLAETTNLRLMLETKQPVVVYDTYAYSGWKRMSANDWLRSNVGAPISVYGEVIGFILLDSETPGFFTPVHAERLEAFANQAALAIHNANLLKQAQAEVAERKRAEESLKIERKKMQDYLDIAGVMMLALDRHGRVALINQKGCEILGYSAAEVIGKNWIETFLPAEVRAELIDVFETLSVGDTASTSYHENPVLTKNGEQRMIAWHNTLLRDAQGTVISTLSSGEDITERKQIEAKLQASESRYRLATQATKDVIWEWNAETNRLLWTENAQIVFGYSPEEVGPDALWWDERIHPEDRERVQSKLYALTAPESAESVWLDEYRFLLKDGSYAYINDHAYIERDSSGKAIRMIGAMSNITERKGAEQALRESEALYRRAIEVAGAVPYYQSYYDNGRSTKFDFIGEGIRQITGYGPEEFTPELWDSLAEEVNLVEELAGYSVDEGIRRVRSGENPVWKCEYRARDRDGKIHWVFEAAVELYDEHGGVRGSIGTFQDITTRKQAEAELRASEERFRQLATNIEEAFWMTDARTGQELYISPAAAAIWGNSVENILSEPAAFINSVMAEDREFVLAALERQRNGEKTGIEYRVRRPDGSIRWVWDRAFPIFDESGEVKTLAGIAADITERKQAEMELVQSQARYQDLFDSSPISLWEEDYSLVKKRIESLQQEGITDLEEYFSSHPDVILELATLVKVIGVNRASMELYNVKQKEDLLKSLPDFVSDETLMHFQYEIQSLMSREKFGWEGSDHTLDGRELIVMVKGSIPPGHEEDWSKVIISITDVTERKLAEEKLRASEERYHSLFQHLVDGFALHEIITDDQGKPIDYRFLEINPAFEKLTGMRAESTVGRRVHEILPRVGNEHFIAIYGKVALTGEPIHFEEYSAPLGRYYAINAYSPRHGQFATTFEDITERKQAEANLRKLSRAVEQTASTIVITDIAGNIEYVNPKFTEITGYTFEEALGKNPRILKSGHTPAEEYGRLWETIIAGEEWHGELFNRKKNGELFWEQATISPIHNEQGEITHFIAVKEDITQRKQSEAETRRRADEFAALYETARDLAVQYNLPTLLKTIVERACDLLRVPGGGLYLYDEARGDLEMVLAVGSSVPTGARLKMGEGMAGRVAQTQQLLIVDDYHTWEGRSLQYEAIPFRAVLQVPMIYGGKLIGVLTVNELRGSERKYTEVDAHLLLLFAEYAASAVHAASLLQETQRRLAELEALYENGLAVGQLLEEREIGSRVIETCARHLSWHHVAIRLLRTGTDELEVIALNQPGLNEEEKLKMEHHFNQMVSRAGQGLSGSVVQTGIPLRTGNVHVHPRYVDTEASIQSGLYMPLIIADRVIGVISVESELSDAFTEQDERLLATLANQAAIAFENARLYQAAQREIAERERAQAALRASEAHYRELADSITEIMFELDQDLHYTHWNKASEIFSGIPAQDVLGQPTQDVFGESDDQSYREKIYRRVLTEQQAQTFETEVFLLGKRRILEINAYPSARGVSVVAREITERRLSEALQQKRIALMDFSARHALDDLMQRAIDEVSELTDSHIGFLHFVEADQKALRLQAWSSETIQAVERIEEKGMHYPVESAGIWADAVRQRRPTIHNDYESLQDKQGLPEGHVRVIRELVVPIIRDDRIAAVLRICNKSRPYDEQDIEITERFADYAWDIIERKQMESALSDERNQLAKRVDERTADLSRANSNLARALRVKDEFLANMSHELRTPLNAILGLSESLSEQVAGPLNEKQQKYLNTINESGHHLLALINDILDLAKIEAGQISLDINKVDVNSVCQASLRMIKQLAQKKNQEVLFEIDGGLGLMWADERRLKQMIVNLLSNAVKFTPENGKLGLEVRGDEVGNRVLITVWDKGIGISNPDLDRLFRPFVQLDSGLAREATGTGLGLALVAQMARLHGGSVSVNSQVGEGSRFTIQLPWEPALAADVSSRLRTTGKFRAIDIHAGNKPKILLIEDTREVVMMLADYLEMAGFTVATAQDGVDGIAQARLTHPDLILMDIQMPRMDGFETTQKLRLDPDFKETPIIALTALAMPNDRQRCLDAGMSEYISKPVNLKMLLKLIRSILFEKDGNLT